MPIAKGMCADLKGNHQGENQPSVQTPPSITTTSSSYNASYHSTCAADSTSESLWPMCHQIGSRQVAARMDVDKCSQHKATTITVMPERVNIP